VLVLTAANSNGAGVFIPTTGYSSAAGNLAVYEVLYAAPSLIEYADIACKLDLHGHDVTVSLAPFYSAASAATATPTTSDPAPTTIPRFHPSATLLHWH